MYLKKLRNKYKACKGDESLTKHYLEVYENHFSKLRMLPLQILEIGVQSGGSLRMWRDYFPISHITGVDINKKCIKHAGKRIDVVIGDQSDPRFLSTLSKFDIIIDDGGHRMYQQQISLIKLWKHLNKGGIYVIEDLATSYWPKFCEEDETPTIEVLKDRIDSLNKEALLDRRATKKYHIKDYNLKTMCFYPGMCFLYKE